MPDEVPIHDIFAKKCCKVILNFAITIKTDENENPTHVVLKMQANYSILCLRQKMKDIFLINVTLDDMML